MNTAAASITHLKNDQIEPHMRPLDLGIIVRLFHYTRAHSVRRNWLFLLVVVRSIQLPALTAVIAAVIKGPIQSHNIPGIAWGVVGFVLLAVSTQVVMHFRQKLALELGEAVVTDLRNQLFCHLQRLTMSFYDRTKLGRIISRLTSDVENVRIGVQEVLFIAMVQFGQMLTAAVFMFLYDRVLFLMVLGLAPVLWTVNAIFRQKLSRAHRASHESFSRVTATLAESINGIRVTQAFARESKNSEMFRDLAEEHASNNFNIARTHGQLLPLLELNSQFFIAALLLVGGYRVLHPAYDASVGDLVGFFLMANLFFSPIALLGLQYTQALTSMAAAERVFRLLDTQPDWRDPLSACTLQESRGQVELRDVAFEYLPNQPVLHDIRFSAEPGQMIALVGETGSGKTTITHLIAKFHLPTQGQVLIDGHDLTTIQTNCWHHLIGVMSQHSFLFAGTVLDNIRFSRPTASDEEVVEAARRLDCLEALQELPDGLQTQVGERGDNLSLGQRQLVCFARALLADPRILILDEATSSVDALTEQRVQRALRLLLKGRTSFVVAHRLSTIRQADMILVLDQGRIIERGNHVQLLELGGHYAMLHRNCVAC